VESGSQPSLGRARQPRRRPTQVVVGRSARWATSGLATSTSTLSSEACAQQQAYKLLAARTRAHLVHSGDVVCKELAFLTPPPRPTEREQVFEPLWCVSVVRLLAPGATGLIVLPPVAQSIPGIPLGLLGLGGGEGCPNSKTPKFVKHWRAF
jgi:hypothetical protein